MQKDNLIWAYLIHLSYNMWPGREVAGMPYDHYRPFLRFDDALWNELLPRRRDAVVNMLVIDVGDGWSSNRIRRSPSKAPGRNRECATCATGISTRSTTSQKHDTSGPSDAGLPLAVWQFTLQNAPQFMRLPDDNKRRQIVATATEMFASQPYHKVRLDDVAATAGVGKGTLYVYFQSKEELYFTIIYEGLAKLLGRLRSQLAA